MAALEGFLCSKHVVLTSILQKRFFASTTKHIFKFRIKKNLSLTLPGAKAFFSMAFS